MSPDRRSDARRPGEAEADLAPEDRALVQRLARSYAPEPLSGARRAAFDAALEERLARRRRTALWLPAAAACAAALALTLWLLPSGGPSEPLPVAGVEGPETVAQSQAPVAVAEAEPAAYAQWEEQLIYPSTDTTSETALFGADDAEALPEDYSAIASLFLGG